MPDRRKVKSRDDRRESISHYDKRKMKVGSILTPSGRKAVEAFDTRNRRVGANISTPPSDEIAKNAIMEQYERLRLYNGTSAEELKGYRKDGMDKRKFGGGSTQYIDVMDEEKRKRAAANNYLTANKSVAKKYAAKHIPSGKPDDPRAKTGGSAIARVIGAGGLKDDIDSDKKDQAFMTDQPIPSSLVRKEDRQLEPLAIAKIREGLSQPIRNSLTDQKIAEIIRDNASHSSQDSQETDGFQSNQGSSQGSRHLSDLDFDTLESE